METPSPYRAAVLVSLGMVNINRAGWWAADWLVEGHDGDALRTLAGCDDTDTRELNDLLPEALADTGHPLPDVRTALAQVLRWTAEEVLAETRTELDACRLMTDLFFEYRSDLEGQPMAELAYFDSEWEFLESSRCEVELRSVVREACRRQLALADLSARSDWRLPEPWGRKR
ncbi:hypothetical protein [Stackebrandtia soli]|uniref:hypothetical protein n=1 Tax=Stackebrandtia soli TaxID=1892856 RepID=UPI0039E7B56A